MPPRSFRRPVLAWLLAGALTALPSAAAGQGYQIELAGARCEPECDIGGVGELIGTRRGSLGVGMVEAGMFLKLTKEERIVDTTQVPALSNSGWKSKIPQRINYPNDYFEDEGTEEVQEHTEVVAEDMDEDSSDSSDSE